MKKISFLMAAHNEESIIENALSRLLKVHEDYPDMEVLIGLDGCTDATMEIVERFTSKDKCFRLFEMDERAGKQTVIDKLEPHITGDIVIIHDADWIFAYQDSRELKRFVEFFDDAQVGGVTSSFAADFFPDEIDSITSIGFLASGWGNHFLMDYIKRKQTKRSKGLLIVDRDRMVFPFFLDIYRQSALKQTKGSKDLKAGDHLERTLRLFLGGYDIIVPEDRSLPRMQVVYRKQTVKDLLRQKLRGVIAKGKIREVYKTRAGIFNFHIPFFIYILLNMHEAKRLRDYWAILIYCFTSIYAQILVSIGYGKEDARSVWSMRMQR